jgi:hypothetical protein
MRWTKGCAAVACGLIAAAAAAQQGEVDLLRKEVRELRGAMTAQKEEYDSKIKELEDRLGETEAAARELDVEKAVSDRVRLYTRPDASRVYPNRGIFEALEGGLFFTGLFRSRLEGRIDNIDFNSEDSGLDDSGFGFNGRFRLGFGAVLYKDPGDATADTTGEPPRRLQVTALTEFQSYGSFANNSYVNVPSAAGLPVPFAFNILTEPFEDVGIYQGYLYFQRLFDDAFSLKIGRQEMVFGNEFILGNNSFYDGTVHDGVLLNWDKKTDWGVQLSFAYAKEAAADASIATAVRSFDEDEFFVFYGETHPAENLRVDAYAFYFNARSGVNDIFVTGSSAFIFDGALTPPILGHHWTLGARVLATQIDLFGGPLTLNAEAAFQFGADTSTAVGRRSIHGWSTEFIANWRIPPKDDGLKPIATLAYLYAGGGKPGPGGAIGFQPLFVNRHFESLQIDARQDEESVYYPGGGRYGNMDEIPLLNVHAIKAAVSVELAPRVEAGAALIFAFVADDQGYGTGSYGTEIDLFGSYIYSNNLQFAANLGVFFPGRGASRLSNQLFFDPNQPALHSDNEPALSMYIQALLQF